MTVADAPRTLKRSPASAPGDPGAPPTVRPPEVAAARSGSRGRQGPARPAAALAHGAGDAATTVPTRCPPAGLRRRAPAGAGADPLRPHAAIALHLLSRLGRAHGRRPRAARRRRAARAGLRRLPPDELRRLRHARAQHHLRHQRLRRDPAGALGMGRQAAGRLASCWRRARNRPVGRRRARRRGSGARTYRERLREFAEMHPLEVWYARIDRRGHARADADDPAKTRRSDRIEKAQDRSGSELDFPKLADMVGGQLHIRDTPPLIFHPECARAPEFQRRARQMPRRLPRDAARRPARPARPLPRWWTPPSRWWASAASAGAAGSCC